MFSNFYLVQINYLDNIYFFIKESKRACKSLFYYFIICFMLNVNTTCSDMQQEDDIYLNQN